LLTDKDVSIITQVAFKGAVDAQSKPLDTAEGQAEFGVNFSFLKDVLFDQVQSGATPFAHDHLIPTRSTTTPPPPAPSPPQPQQVYEQIATSFPGTTTMPSVTVRNADEQQGPLPDWLYEQAAAVGVTEVYDNRNRLPEAQQKGKNWPWFRSAHNHIDKAFWPPKAGR